MNFLRAVCENIRARVGPDFPVLIKLGMIDALEGGLMIEDTLKIAAELAGMGVNGIEISGGIGGAKSINTRAGIRAGENEGYYIPLAQAARPHTRLPILLVGGFRTKSMMESVLADGPADFISLCRPLISEPDLPNQFRLGLKEQSRCLSGNRCFPKNMREGIQCRCFSD
jgi:2,4-dienoyl-CoA reductase-like NADH-dependent reductase (Old Yellow Enzyme family)